MESEKEKVFAEGHEGRCFLTYYLKYILTYFVITTITNFLSY